MLILKAIIFTILVPGTVAWWLPRNVIPADWTIRHRVGWIPVVLGSVLYFWCAIQFLIRGLGTPNISFARPLEFLIGREPVRLVHQSIYRHTRNPMYVGVLTVLFGESLLVGSVNLFIYAVAVCLWFHFIVVFAEEPHLRRSYGEAYVKYSRDTPRWFALRRRT